MAVNLYQQADATIATAAARAGMALAPADYSQTFQNMAFGYSKGMEKVGAGLAKAAGVATIAATKLVEDAKLAKENVWPRVDEHCIWRYEGVDKRWYRHYKGSVKY